MFDAAKLDRTQILGKISYFFANVVLSYFGEPLSDFHTIQELRDVLKEHDFMVEDIIETNDCVNDTYFKFSHLKLVKSGGFYFITTKLNK